MCAQLCRLGYSDCSSFPLVVSVPMPMQTLDLSWNHLGTSGSLVAGGCRESGGVMVPAVTAALCDMVTRNSTLTHLDLSNNQLLPPACKLFGQALLGNHSIMFVQWIRHYQPWVRPGSVCVVCGGCGVWGLWCAWLGVWCVRGVCAGCVCVVCA